MCLYIFSITHLLLAKPLHAADHTAFSTCYEYQVLLKDNKKEVKIYEIAFHVKKTYVFLSFFTKKVASDKNHGSNLFFIKKYNFTFFLKNHTVLLAQPGNNCFINKIGDILIKLSINTMAK